MQCKDKFIETSAVVEAAGYSPFEGIMIIPIVVMNSCKVVGFAGYQKTYNQAEQSQYRAKDLDDKDFDEPRSRVRRKT